MTATDAEVEAAAEAMWRAEVAEVGAARRAREAEYWADQAEEAKSKWRRFAKAALLAASQARALSSGEGWQDISTAPKDGTWVMLYCQFEDRAEYRVCRWVADDRPPSRHGEFGPFVWSTYDSLPNLGVIAEKVPTHWQPLPQPPSKDNTNE